MSKEIKSKEKIMFWEVLPTKEGIAKNKGRQVVDWDKSVGCKVNFIYNDIEGEVEILSYTSKGQKLDIRYEDKLMNEIKTGNFQRCKIGKLLGKVTSDFKIEIGTHFKDNKRDLIVISRHYEKDKNEHTWKCYGTICLKCGWDKGITKEGNLLNNQIGCACCAGLTAVLGINTIWDTDRWMCDLGVSEEDAKRLIKCTHEKITVKCPDCGKEKTIRTSSIYEYKSINCSCGNGLKYPEKFINCLLNQLKIDYKTEYTPSWSNNRRYDFYIKPTNSIIEAHGSQHPGTKYHKLGGFSGLNKRARTPQQELENDIYKEQLAKENGVKNYIAIDCSLSDMEFIKENILNSRLAELYDLSNIDWLECEKFALSNRVKEVCDYWNNKEDWETTTDLCVEFNLNKSTIIKYLNKGVNQGWCDYNSKIEDIKSKSRNGKLSGKPIEVFINNISLGVYESGTELSKTSKEILGITLSQTKISAVCLGNQDTHKGYTFRYITKEEYEQRKSQQTA